MKLCSAFAVCLLAAAGQVYAQAPQKATKKMPMASIATLPQRNGAGMTAIGGYFTDMGRMPVKGVKAFVYNNYVDSSITGSGYADSAGYYESNRLLPGMYDLKIAYPGTKFTMMVTGVPVQSGKITNVSFMKAAAPVADTTIAYADIAPAPPQRTKTKAMAAKQHN